MGESLMERHSVQDEGLRVVNCCYKGRKNIIIKDNILTVPYQKATANYVPAAAVIHRLQALSGIIGRKASVGCVLSLASKLGAQPQIALDTGMLELYRG